MFTLKMRNFWAGAEARRATLPRMVESVVGEPIRVVTEAKLSCDLEIVCHRGGMRQQLTSAARSTVKQRRFALDRRWMAQQADYPTCSRSIWYTGENVRPPFSGDWAGFLSFDVTSPALRNAYLPIWFHKVNEFNGGAALHMKELISERTPDGRSRNGFMCAFLGNPEPMRLHILKILGSLGQVDIFGWAGGGFVDDRHAISSAYRFIAAMENDVYPGYVTEKALEGVRSGAVHVWRGIDSAGLINPAALINVCDFGTPEDLLAFVEGVASSPEEQDRLRTAPILMREPSLAEAERLVESVLA
jgi:hypothetical protein